MPGRIPMTARQRATLLALPDSEAVVVRHHSLDAQDLAAIGVARTPATKLGYALQLCCLRYPGRHLRQSVVVVQSLHGRNQEGLMGVAEVLYGLLTTAAALMAQGAAGEFAKGAGKTAFDAVRARLADRHKVRSLALLGEAQGNPAYAAAIKSDLEKPEVAADDELTALAARLMAEIEKLPPRETAPYAVEIREIKAGGALLFDRVQGGVRAETASSTGDMTFRNVTAPPGK